MQSNTKNYIIGIVLIIIIILAIVIFTHHNSEYGTNYPATTTPSTTHSTGSYGTAPSTNATTNTPPASVNPSGSASTENPLPPQTVSVNYTDSGFSPTSITINQGDTVTFVNQSASAMWVSGDPNAEYPQSYPGFNEGAQVSNGGKYSILFSQTGTYQYYNQDHVGSVGVIIVQNPTQ